MTEHTKDELDRQIRDLAKAMDLTLEDARGRLIDDDLLMMNVESRYGFSDEEAVQQWREGKAFARALARMVEEPIFFNDATRLMASDLIARAEEFFRRAEERVAGNEIRPREVRDDRLLLV